LARPQQDQPRRSEKRFEVVGGASRNVFCNAKTFDDLANSISDAVKNLDHKVTMNLLRANDVVHAQPSWALWVEAAALIVALWLYARMASGESEVRLAAAAAANRASACGNLAQRARAAARRDSARNALAVARFLRVSARMPATSGTVGEA
jgi:hypothetical protein